MAGYELATAYVSLAAESSEISKSIGRAFATGDKIAAKTGRSMGKAMGVAFDKEPGPDFDKLAADAKKADDAVRQSAEQLARKRADAARAIEIAEQKVLETREKSIARDKQVVSAEKDLAAARKQGDPDTLATAEKRLAAARDSAAPTSSDMTAEDRLTKARQKYVTTSRDGVQALSKYAKEQSQATKKLEEAKEAAAGADRSTGKAASAFSHLGDRVKAAMHGNFKGAFKGIETEAGTAASKVEDVFEDAGHQAALEFGNNFKSKLNGAMSTIGKGLKWGGLGIAAAVTGGVGLAVKGGFDRMADIEDAKASLAGLGKSAAEVDKIMGSALTSVKGTAFSMGDAASVAATMTASGIKPGKELTKTLSLVADSATIAKTDIGDMGLIWSSVAAKGKLQGDDAQQLLAAGVPIWQMVGDAMGKTAGEAQELGSKGKVSFEIFQKAMEKNLGGAAKKSGDTVRGSFANLKAAVSRLGADLLEEFYPLIAPALQGLTSYLDQLGEKVTPVIESVTKGLGGLYDIIAKGDFTGRDNFFGIDEDSAVVGFLFDLREAAIAVNEKAFKPLGQFLSDHIVPVFTALGAGLATWGIQAAIGAITTAVAALIPEGMTLVGALGAAVAAFNWLPLAIGAAIGALVWFFTQTELGRDLVAKAFEGIKIAVTTVADVFTTKVWPALLTGWDVLKTVVMAVWNGVLLPVFTAIGSLVQQIFVGIVMPAFQQLVGFMQTTVWPIIQKLWTDYIQPIFTLIGGIVVWLWNNAIKPYFGLVAAFISNVLGPVVVWLWQTVISPAFTAIGAVIGFVFNSVIFPLLDAFKALLVNVIAPAAVWLWQNVIVPAFNGIKTAVGAVAGWITGTVVPALATAWSAIGAAAKWLYTNIIQPVWTGIKIAIAVVIAAVTVYVGLWVTLFKTLVAPLFKWLYASVIKPVWSAIKTAIGAVVAWFQGTAWPILKTVIAAVSAAFGALKAALSVAWKFIKNNVIAPVVSWFQNTAWPIFSKVIGWIRTKFEQFKLGLKIIWAFIKGTVIAPVVNWFKTTVVGAFSNAVGSVRSKFQGLKDKLSEVWSAIKNKVVKPVIDWFTGTVKPKIDTLTDNIKSAFRGMKDSILDIWDKVKSGMKKPINGIINIYRNHIKTPFNSVINKILGGGSKAAKAVQLPDMQPFATGGWTGPGSRLQPAGVVHADEFVVKKSSRRGIEKQAPGFLDQLNTHGARALTRMGLGYASGGRVLHGYKEIESIPHTGVSVTSTIRKGARTAGTGSVSKHAKGYAVDFAGTAQAMKDFFNYVRANYKVSELIHTPMGGKQLSRGGIPKAHFPAKTASMHYNHVHVGGYEPGEKQGAGTSGEGGGLFENPFTGLWKKISGKVDSAVGTGAVGGILKGATKSVVSSAKDLVGKKISEAFDFVGDSWDAAKAGVSGMYGAARWGSTATQALQMTGNYSKANYNSLMRRMGQESNYKADAQNNWDSNAAKGQNSRGLMQVIPSTFAAYRDKSLPNNIFDPLANIVASINYTKARYGSLTKGWDRKGGYATGGYTGAGTPGTPAGIVHADEFVLRSEAQRSISKAAPGFLDRLNRMGAGAIGYAKGGLVGYASGGKVSPTAKIGSSKVTVLLEGLSGTEKQVTSAAGKLADGIVKVFNDRMKAAKTATVNKLSDSLSSLKKEASALKKSISATTSKSKKSAIAKLSDELADLRKHQSTLKATAREVTKTTKVVGKTAGGKLKTKTVTTSTAAAKKAAKDLKGVQKQIDSTQAALTKARRGDYSGAAAAATKRLKSVQAEIDKTDKALKAARRGDYQNAALLKGTAAYNKYAAGAVSKLESYAARTDTLAAKLKDANTKLSDAQKLWTDYRSSMVEKFQGTYALSEESATTGIETIIRGFKNGAATVKTFASQLNQLKAKGLSGGLIDQIAQMGAESGSKVAKNLLTGSTSQIKEITKQYNALNTASTTSGTNLADQMYRNGVNSAKGLVKGLESQLANVEKASESLANKVLATVRKKLKIKSPSRAMRALGVYTGEGFQIGVENKIPAVQHSLEALVAPPETSGVQDMGRAGIRPAAQVSAYSPTASVAASDQPSIQIGDIYGHTAADVIAEFKKDRRRQLALRGA